MPRFLKTRCLHFRRETKDAAFVCPLILARSVCGYSAINSLQLINPKSQKLQHQWYDDKPEWKTWVKECLSNSEKFLCIICNKNLTCGRIEIDIHSKTKKHLENLRLYNFNNSGSPNVVLPGISSSVCSQLDSSSSLSSSELGFNERVKAAEIQFATLLAQNNILLSTAPQRA
ncbi:hypothetical protein KQX54_010910 [Cotesia glomerata]|uniref:U1-type domain-containing protein n=1 Tax=Cotesia glomerata TaxID=32391 RepID=A0AAV7IB95_COTGL|nr:hypothetical protein KQX54_010910 [Cotesia glomerata]